MDSEINNYLKDNRSLLIVPAGHGKTTLLIKCILRLQMSKNILILTHTHAGIASIKQKMSKERISLKNVSISTITGFAQHIAILFYGQKILENQEDKNYFNDIQEKVLCIISLNGVLNIIKRTYSVIFVDEYQDCSIIQHKIIETISSVIPTHLLGDPLQAIIRFNDEPIDFSKHLNNFKEYNFLSIPWRWNNCGNKDLGKSVIKMRKLLLNNSAIELDDSNEFKGVFFDKHSTEEQNFWPTLGNTLSKLKSDSLLILFPPIVECGITYRAKCRQRFDFNHDFELLEAIDDKDFYKCAQTIDSLRCEGRKITGDLLIKLLEAISFNKGDVTEWFSSKGVKHKRTEKEKCNTIKTMYENFVQSKSFDALYQIIDYAHTKLKWKYKRPALLNAIKKVLHDYRESSCLERMKTYKNKIRIVGRKVNGKCIGNTWLTKGLEFDDVIILDAHKYKDCNNFYVAISRACKNLYVFSKTSTLKFQ